MGRVSGAQEIDDIYEGQFSRVWTRTVFPEMSGLEFKHLSSTLRACAPRASAYHTDKQIMLGNEMKFLLCIIQERQGGCANIV